MDFINGSWRVREESVSRMPNENQHFLWIGSTKPPQVLAPKAENRSEPYPGHSISRLVRSCCLETVPSELQDKMLLSGPIEDVAILSFPMNMEADNSPPQPHP